MAKAILVIKVATEDGPVSLADSLFRDSGPDLPLVAERMSQVLVDVASGTRNGKIVARVDSSTTSSTNLPLRTVSRTVTLLSTTLTNDTLWIGSAKFTFKTTQAVSTNVAISGSVTNAAANLATKINSFSKTGGVVSASSLAGVVTITWAGAAREGALVRVVTTSAGSSITLSASTFADGTTLTKESSTYSFPSGMA